MTVIAGREAFQFEGFAPPCPATMASANQFPDRPKTGNHRSAEPTREMFIGEHDR